MTVSVRRVVTGHDKNGKAVVTIDEMGKNLVTSRPGVSTCVVWTEPLPADNSSDGDGARRQIATTMSNGMVCRVIEFAPGCAPRNHRTDSIDFAMVLSGEIDMQLDESEVHLKAGDVMVQRGTIHNWVNRGTEPCVIAFVLVHTAPVKAGGKVLQAVG